MMSTKQQKNLSKKELKDLQSMFAMYDLDKDGEISGKEIEKLFQVAGFNPTQDDLNQILKTADKDENSSINFDEFVQLTKNTSMAFTPKEKEAELYKAFKTFDKNGDGLIDYQELKTILTLGGDDEPDIDSIMNEFDKNGDGVLSYEEFVALWSAS